MHVVIISDNVTVQDQTRLMRHVHVNPAQHCNEMLWTGRTRQLKHSDHTKIKNRIENYFTVQIF